ncbi:cysteine desulfurase [Halococcus morrhuae DSM 1307]|uniref:Cysteine desulfurase n=1 Tax=Halococcus morrhuae DSM 1307 TaxID=931277 RepID=M0MLI2_HALMO|nr:aminotransferase class V-fold PLP-dependent enzyme [Halococcus morrhuae]EMA45584.1 cysteine desulfurase [Halococcus morrhuae DSM 1307]
MDPLDLREEIPVLDEVTYLNTGAASPAPTSVVDAATDEIERQQHVAPAAEGSYPALFETFAETRERVAEFLGADTDEIALTQSTADGISRVATALPWQEGDVVVRTDCEHSAGVLPWQRLRDTQGIEVRVLETEAGRIDREQATELLADADLLCLSSITWNYGTRFPVAELTEIAHDAGARVLVDAVQSPGQVDVDVGEWGADFVVGAGHKWLCGPWGAGFLYVADEATDALVPERVGYRSVTDPEGDSYEFSAGAKRLEIGTTSPAPYAGLQAAMDAIDSIGIDTVEGRIERLTDRLKEGIDDDRLLSPREYESGLVTIAADDPEATVSRLADEDVTIRSIPSPAAVRVSVHVYNTDDDIDALCEVL